MTTEHTLRIRCPTWGHLENFYDSKVKNDNILLARVPFSPAVGSIITIALEMPDGIVVDIAADVEGVRKAPDGKKSAIRMALQDMAAVRPRLARAVAVGRQEAEPSEPTLPLRDSPARTGTGLPVPIPSDVPIDEPVPMIQLPKAEDVPAEARDRYQDLEKSLAAMREKAAHDVLGVEWDAEVSDIRVAYFALVKQYHPDVLSKHGSEAVSLLGAEIFIYVNKAYDRLRDSAVAAGKAIVAGPALLPHSGWIADFDDIGAARPRVTHRVTDFAAPVPVPVKAMSSLAANKPEIDADVEVSFSKPLAAASEVPQALPATQPSTVPALEPNMGGDLDSDAVPEASQLEQDSLFVDARSTESGMSPIEGKGEDDKEEVLDVAALYEEARTLLKEKQHDDSRERLAQVLEHEPRNREARALYHVAYGYTLLERDNRPAAMTQFEVALKHDPNCGEAVDAQSRTAPRKRIRRPSLLERIFKR